MPTPSPLPQRIRRKAKPSARHQHRKRSGQRSCWLFSGQAARCLADGPRTNYTSQASGLAFGAVARGPSATAGAEQLRFGALLSRNGMHARLDLGLAALNGEIIQGGTTNVDFNKLMVNAPSHIGRHELVHLSVGQPEGTLERTAGHGTELSFAD